MGMKYVVCLGDGMSDWPIPALGNRTPLDVAHTPNMDRLVSLGQGGMCWTVPEGCYPGSDVANMGLLGYDPRQYYTGRGAIEAAAMGIVLAPDDMVFRCNLVTIEQGQMASFTAGHIGSEAGRRVIASLNDAVADRGARFYPGVGYRHILVVSKPVGILQTVPPHDLTDKAVDGHWPRGEGEALLADIVARCRAVLQHHPVNQERLASNALPVTDIWPWSPGRMPQLPSFKDHHGKTGGIVTAVDLLRGLAQLTGLLYPMVPGATGFLDTNYQGKVAAARSLLDHHDFVYVHIEAPDECGHLGDVQKKCQAIEDFDRLVVGPLMDDAAQRGNVAMMVLPDHPTPCALKTHVREAVPVAVMAPGLDVDRVMRYHEASCQSGSFDYQTPWSLLTWFLSLGKG